MYFVYILYSKRKNLYYIGQTKDIEERLKRHNSNQLRATKNKGLWKVVYTEEYRTRSEAIIREQFLKSPGGWKELQVIKSKINRDVAQPG